MSRKKLGLGFVIILLSVFSACTKSQKAGSPVAILGDYVTKSFAVKSVQDKPKLMELTTGKVHEILEKMDDSSFNKNFIDEKKEFLSLKIKDERTLADNRYSVTYELSYMDKTGNSTAKVTTKKHAIFAQPEGHWLIDEVQTLKTLIENQNEMSL